MCVYVCAFYNSEWRVITVLRDNGGGTSGGVEGYYQGNNKLSKRIILQIASLIDNHIVIYRHDRQPVIINCHMCHIVMI